MVYELEAFRNAILNKDYDFFEQAASQSICASMILEKAHLNKLSKTQTCF